MAGRRQNSFVVKEIVSFIADVMEEERAYSLAAIARETLAETEAEQGVYPYSTYVDGIKGRREEEVRPDGVIEYVIHLFAAVLDEAYKEVYRRSPIRGGNPPPGHPKGYYRDNIYLLVNGVAYDLSPNFDFEGIVITPGDEVYMVDTAIYARKIEGLRVKEFKKEYDNTLSNRSKWVGKISFKDKSGKGRKGLSVQAPDGVFELAMKRLISKKNSVAGYPFTAKFVYVDAGFVSQIGGGKVPTIKRGKMKGQPDLRFPAIQFFFQ